MSRGRDRHGRGLRGPMVRESSVAPVRPQTQRQHFDAITLRIVRDIDTRWSSKLGLVEYAVEDVPQLRDGWTDAVPLAALTRGSGARPTRLIFYRRPIEHRCATIADLEDLLLMVAVEQVAELLGMDPREVHPRYRDDL